jgi:hypothetical protein
MFATVEDLMDSTTQSPQQALNTRDGLNESGLFSSELVLNILQMIFAGAPLAEVLSIIARLVESRATAHYAPSGFQTITERNSTAQPRPVFLISALTWGLCLSGRMVRPAAQLPFGKSL